MDFPAQNLNQSVSPNQPFQNPSGTYYAPSAPQQEKKGLKGFLLLEIGLSEIMFVVLMLAILFETLNFFNILSLSSIYPNQLGWLPHLKYASETQNIPINSQSSAAFSEEPTYSNYSKTWKAGGILYQYNDNRIKIKVGVQILDLVYSYENSMFYKQTSSFVGGATPSAAIESIPYTLYDLDQQENLGKKVEVYYTTDTSGTNTIQTITTLN